MPRRLLDSPWTLPALCCLVAAIFRFYDLSQASLWRDEIYSIGESEVLSHILVRKGNGFGYFFLLHLIRGLFGTTPISLRVLSAVAGTAAAGVAWAIALQVTGRRTAALVAALGIALLPLHILLSREARMYSLWTLTLWTSYLCLLQLDSRRRATAFWGAILALIAAFSFHNFTLIYVPALFLAWWVYPHSPDYRRQKMLDGAWLAAATLAIGGALALRLALQVPSLMAFLKSLATQPLWAQSMGFFESLLQLSFFPTGSRALAALSFAGAAALLLCFWGVAVLQSIKLIGRQKAFSISIAFLLPLLLFALFPIRHYPRLLLPCALYLILPFAFWASQIKRGPYLSGLGLLILGGLFAQAWKTVGVDREPWKKLCDEIASVSTEHTVIAAWPSQTFNSFAYCYRGKGELIKLPDLLEHPSGFEKKEVWILFFPTLTKASNLAQTETLEMLWRLRRASSPVPELRVLAPAVTP